ncbi:hypothetical protein HMPREF1624_03191 [Sporothrix schenckii ATCC 58251]|uniref:Amine oxidase domain-containing protein n=1 Tax=Sporothrix schenckii (strain ATCC 58251 / de Perez 2211183) TaxID=1391915 RepID=U7PXZ9_SPOS1|nr:hypothetical protein HMPREF1624_03191 [Sporothrix schenckii ATCC 58251]
MSQRRRASFSPSPRLPVPKRVAVIGGGLTGLTTAYYLAMLLPATSHITVYEGSGRLGGWIDSESSSSSTTSDTANNEKKKDAGEHERTDVLEAGARMVAPQKGARYDDFLLLELIDQLGLHEELRVSEWKAAQYIYYPDHLVNVSLGNLRPQRPQAEDNQEGRSVTLAEQLAYWKAFGRWVVWCATRVLQEPLFRSLLPGAFSYLLPSTAKAEKMQARMVAASKAPGRYPPASDDESAGAFMTRMSGGNTALTDNMLSAVMHGIYGGDVWKLSVASSILRPQWLKEAAGPLFRLYDRQAKIAELRRQQAARMGRAQPEDHDDFPGQNAGLGGGIAGFPPLTAETLRFAEEYSAAKGKVELMMESDLQLLHDIMLRLRDRYEPWLAAAQKKRGTPGYEGDADDGLPREASPFDRLPMLMMRSTGWTQFGFAQGFGTLTDALARSLRSRPNVTIRSGEPVTGLRYEAQRVRVATPKTSADGDAYDRVVSTVASPTLFRMAGGSDTSGDSGQLPSLRDAHAVTIMVVNLHYAEPNLHRPYGGFGYLIPQSVPLEENPEGALGVIFDSDREMSMRELFDFERTLVMDDAHATDVYNKSQKGLDATRAARAAADSTRGSKYTVMLGGHLWDGYQYPDDFPSADEAVRMAEAVLRRHLRDTPRFGGGGGAPMPTPIATRTKLCRECIPQHYVGHARRMAALDAELKAAFGGRLAVAGGSFTATGPGVLPSVRSAYDVALRVAGRGYQMVLEDKSRRETTMAHVGDTGLGRFADPATDSVGMRARELLPLRFNNKHVYARGYFGRNVHGDEYVRYPVRQ